MDDNRIEGAARETEGRVKDAWGGLAGDPRTQIEGKLDQARGAAQQLYGRAKDRLRGRLEERSREARERLESTVELIGRKPLAAVGVATFVGLTLGLLLSTGRTTHVVYVPR
jgi:uncharacterized protein YjbJ (UPF0337 family)